MFGAANDDTGNISYLLIDVNYGSGQGVVDLATDLTDTSDGLRSEISSAALTLSSGLVSSGAGFDIVVAITAPNIAAGYTLGTDGLAGAFDAFEYQQGISVSFDGDTGALPAAGGTTIAGPDAVEVRIPFSVLDPANGTPNLGAIYVGAATTADSGFPSPNTLPENPSDTFDATQEFVELAPLPITGLPALINEVHNGADDWIEVHNPGSFGLNVGGWALRMRDSANVRRDYVFPNGTAIPANGYIVVSDQGKSSPPSDAAPFFYAGFNIPWDETRGGSVELVDPFGYGIDYVDWRNTADEQSTDIARAVPYPTAFSGTIAGPAGRTGNMSIGRSASSTDSDSASDWENTSGADADSPSPASANDNTATVPSSLIKIR
jgi:hypothetical protein